MMLVKQLAVFWAVLTIENKPSWAKVLFFNQKKVITTYFSFMFYTLPEKKRCHFWDCLTRVVSFDKSTLSGSGTEKKTATFFPLERKKSAWHQTRIVSQYHRVILSKPRNFDNFLRGILQKMCILKFMML